MCVYFMHLYATSSYSFVDGQLGCFILAIVNSAAMNTGVHSSFELVSSLDICPGVGLLDHMLTILLFKEPPYCPPIEMKYFYI